jgi:PEP-CTERM motif
MKKFLLGAVLAASSLIGSAQAATFTSESGFGPLSGLSSCKSGSNTAAFASGTVLDATHYTGNCVGFFGAQLDTSAKTIALSGLGIGNYESGFFEITGITGPAITGVSTLGLGGLFDPNAYGGGFATDVPTPVLSFTANSIRIEWSSVGNASPTDQFAYGVFNFDPSSSVFSYATGAVPEPASWALMIAGFGLVGSAMRRRKPSVSVSYA